jgi:IMP cyclohydrolase
VEVQATVKTNMEALGANVYPGRGIVIGMTPDGRRYAQVYWIMGRSENSRNRVFVREGNLVRTRAYDESKVQDPSLVIYNAVRVRGRCHIVSNGDQTDTIYDTVGAGGTFDQALFMRTFEPDDPNFTPRIAGAVDLDDRVHAYKLAILKAIANDGRYAARHVFSYETAAPGVGHCLTTYSGDGTPLPSFEGEPYLVQIVDDAAGLARLYWDALNADNRVSLLAKLIDAGTGEVEIEIINKHAGT